MGPASATVGQALTWAKARGAAQVFIEYLPLYWAIWPDYGLDPAVGAAQSAKETPFGHFGGAVIPDQHNPCGLKVAKPTGDSRNDHATFPDWATGVRAHGQHLALYAGIDVAGTIVDPRHFPSIRGAAKTVEDLGGRWAPSPDYGVSIVRDYLAPLHATNVQESAPASIPVAILDPSGRRLCEGWLDGDRTVVAIRDLAEALGIDVDWDPGGPSATLSWPGIKKNGG